MREKLYQEKILNAVQAGTYDMPESEIEKKVRDLIVEIHHMKTQPEILNDNLSDYRFCSNYRVSGIIGRKFQYYN